MLKTKTSNNKGLLIGVPKAQYGIKTQKQLLAEAGTPSVKPGIGESKFKNVYWNPIKTQQQVLSGVMPPVASSSSTLDFGQQLASMVSGATPLTTSEVTASTRPITTPGDSWAAYKSNKLAPISAHSTAWTNPAINNSIGSRSKIIGQEKSKIIDQVNSKLSKDKPAPNLRPALDALNYALANRSINKIRNTQLARKNMYYNTPSLSVRPVTDLPAEVLAAQQDALSQVRSTDASSDPTINLLSKNIAGAQRGKMRNEMIAGRATALLQDRNRFDEQQRQNQQAAAETENKNLDRAQDFADYKTGVNTAALEAKKDLTSGFLSNVGKNMGMGAEYNLGMSAIQDQNARQHYNDLVKRAMAQPDEGTRAGELAKADEWFAGYTAQPKLNYNQAMAKGAEGTFIAKLLTGKLRKP